MQRIVLHRSRRLVVTGAVLLGLVAAAGAQQASATTEPAPAGDPDASVVLGFLLEPTNLDIIHQAGAALDQVLLDNVYETLVKSSPEGEISPGLATLEISEDQLTYTLTLPEGVTFHDGDPLTASDVVWTLEQTKEGGGPGSVDLAGITTIEAPDDLTAVLTLGAPDSDLAFNLSRRAGVVLNEGAADLENSANGTGPFAFDEWNQGSSITLVRNDGYWGDVPQIADVTFQYFSDSNAAVNAVLDGEADLITGVDSELVGQFEDDPDYVVTSGPTNGEFTLGYNNADEALSDPLVRQAITQAIDKAGVLELFNGYGTLIGSPVPPTDPWYEDLTGVNPYDPDAARALLEEAGYADGLTLSFIVPNHYPTRVADFVVSQLADVGITLELQLVAFPAWLEQVYTNHDYDVTLVLHVEPRDIDNYANPEYYWQYNNPEVQQLLTDAGVSADPDQANELRREAAAIIAADAPVDWLLLASDLVVSRAGVTGFPEFDMNARFDASGLVVEG